MDSSAADHGPRRLGSRSWVVQLQQMLKKNYLVKKRRKKAATMEILYPVYFVAILALMKVTFPPGVTFPVAQFGASVNASDPGPVVCRFDPEGAVGVGACYDHTGSAVRATDGAALGYVKSADGVADTIAQRAAATAGMTAVGFASASELAQHVQHDHAFFFGVEFGTGARNYTLRTPSNRSITDPSPPLPPLIDPTPDAHMAPSDCRPKWNRAGPGQHMYNASTPGDTSKLQKLLDLSSCDSNAYLSSGFLLAQTSLDEAIVHTLSAGPSPPPSLSVELRPLPRTEFAQNFASQSTLIRSIFSIYLVFAITSPVRWLITFIVEEKEKKVKEGMLMMGLHYSVFWASWGLTYLAVFGIISVLATAVIVFSGMVTQSSPVLIFLNFVSFGISLIPFSLGASTFLTDIRKGGPIASLVVTMMSLPFAAVVALPSLVTVTELWWSCLLSPLAFCIGMDAIWTFDGGWQGKQGMTFQNIGTPGSFGMSLSDTLLMMWIDIILYTLIAIYLDTVVPQPIGTSRPPYFLCSPAYWKATLGSDPAAAAGGGGAGGGVLGDALLDDLSDEGSGDDCAREDMPALVNGQAEAVRLHKVTKVFRKNYLKESPDDVTAVNRVSLSLPTGQIFGLLGHNGAGKTTLMGIMSGLHEPTNGSAHIDGRDVVYHMSAIRQSLGVCPQHDVLFDNLTVMEHVELFAALKGVPAADIRSEATNWLTQVELLEKESAFAETLSGGQKRRLSVALALIGAPRIVILDEPTTGLDPVARRSLWQVLKNAREERLIILSTHFLDEADLLADRKAIIAHGKLKCVGSSLFLKTHFGLEYSLEASKSDTAAPAEPVVQLVQKYVPSARLKLETPNQVNLLLPVEAVSAFPQMLADLDVQLHSLQLHSYSVTAGTLEDVFMKFAEPSGGDFDTSTEGHRHRKGHESSDSAAAGEGVGVGGDEWSSTATAIMPGASEQSDLTQTGADATTVMKKQLVAMLRAKFLIMKKNKGSYIMAVLFPLIFLYVSARISTLMPTGSGTAQQPPPMPFELKSLGGSAATVLPIAFNPALATSLAAGGAGGQDQFVKWLQASTGVTVDVVDESSVDEIQASYLSDTTRRENWQGCVYFNSIGPNVPGLKGGGTAWDYVVLYNMLSTHSAATYVATIDAAIITLAGTGTAAVGLPAQSQSYDEIESPMNRLKHAIPNVSGGIFAVLAYLMPAYTIVAFAVRDRELRTKHQLAVMGLPSVVYWSANFIGDSLIYGAMGSAAVILMAVQGQEPQGGDALGVYAVLTLLFVMVMVLFCYVISFLFNKHHTVYQVVPVVLQLSSIIASVLITILKALEPRTGEVTNKVFIWLFPHYSLIGASTALSTQYTVNQATGGHGGYWTDPTIQSTLLAYVCMIPLYLGLLVYLDRRKSRSQTGGSQLVLPPPAGSQLIIDAEVLDEQRRAADGGDYAVCANQLGKIYNVSSGICSRADSTKKPVHAVQRLSLAVPGGECLGLLGRNGAGKTTTIKMLTAEERIGTGSATINGHDVGSEAHKCWQSLGFCPQHDAQYPELTTREHCELFARVKDLPNPSAAAESMMRRLDLLEHADKLSAKLSGGNRRKLSAAVALLGQPKAIFLDEPSSGMDVATRRNMWAVISESLRHSSVVLTTHSMEEADALSSRIAIMVNGALRCIGTSQELKSRFGRGYILEVALPANAASAADVARVEQYVHATFPGAGMHAAEAFGGRLKFVLSSEEASAQPVERQGPAFLFAELEKSKLSVGIESYTVSQPSLEQIFLDISAEQLPEQQSMQAAAAADGGAAVASIPAAAING